MDYHRLWLEVSNDRALCLFLPKTPGNQWLEKPTVILTLNLWVTLGFFNSPRFLTDNRFRKKESFLISVLYIWQPRAHADTKGKL